MEGSILSRGDRDFVVYENDNFGGVGGRYWKSKVDIVQVPCFHIVLKGLDKVLLHLPFGYYSLLLQCFSFICLVAKIHILV